MPHSFPGSILPGGGVSVAKLLSVVILVLYAIPGAGAQDTFPEPPNEPLQVIQDRAQARVFFSYGRGRLLELDVRIRTPKGLEIPAEAGVRWIGKGEPPGDGPALSVEEHVEQGKRNFIRQRIVFRLHGVDPKLRLALSGTVHASPEAFPAETRGPAQERFPLVRNSVGLCLNLRNNAVYDRRFDWVLAGPADGPTRIEPLAPRGGEQPFAIRLSGRSITLVFSPHFYQKGRNLPWYRPWSYRPWKGSIAGWCSWWPYRRKISEEVVKKVCRLFAEKLRDYGFSYIQIDDGYQAGYGGLPGDWLNTNERFPSGLAGLAETIRSFGMKPAIWVNVHFGDKAFAEAHPGWFMHDPEGALHKGPWLDYGLDGSVPEAVDAVVRPVYRALRKQGWRYVKIDTLRHLLYDGIYPCRAWFQRKGMRGEEALRRLLEAAREELGRDTYILACWGVLPEVIGIADGCRLGTDGFGPTTLVQYNSFNNVVWRNDPDHMDVTPEGQEIIRPVTVCMAGAMMMLTDRVEVYAREEKIEGARRCAPVPFTVPGQLYDFDPRKTENLRAGLRNEKGGGPPGPIDADPWGEFCEWWLLDITRPFGAWSVLARMSYTEDLPERRVAFADLGLSADRPFAVYEFWTRTFLGVFTGAFTAPAQKKNEARVYCLRPVLERPQVLSTSRHITQGWASLVRVEWSDVEKTLSGESRMVKGDPYTLVFLLPEGGPGPWTVSEAAVAEKKPDLRIEGRVVRITVTPAATGTISWRVHFR